MHVGLAISCPFFDEVVSSNSSAMITADHNWRVFNEHDYATAP